jgi:formate hydrogenlyase transcriptional activator
MATTANGIDYRWISGVEKRSAREGFLARDQDCSRLTEQEIIGESPKLQNALEQIEIVAPTDATVLIQGETGTGKELVARMIHNLSGRRHHSLVKVNCAAIPRELLESELFGHERGAFTGAISQQIGRFELADKGTLFLDEIGDIPSELQPKLLRVLQEHEFERLGSTHTIRTNIRLIAATHRNLAQMVGEGQFRADLYYRLNVFPITLPPLRERREDIPLLVWHFLEKFAQRMNKQIEVIPSEAMEALIRHSWTGNIRELQNFIERAVILSRGPVLEAPLSELRPLTRGDAAPEPVTLRDAEREHILRILRESDGVASAAAARLGVPRTTLHYKMRRLGITPSRAQAASKPVGVNCQPTSSVAAS